MDRRDIANYRRWHRDAALRGMRAGMDIVYVYAAHDLSLAMHFLQRRRNQVYDGNPPPSPDDEPAYDPADDPEAEKVYT